MPNTYIRTYEKRFKEYTKEYTILQDKMASSDEYDDYDDYDYDTDDTNEDDDHDDDYEFHTPSCPTQSQYQHLQKNPMPVKIQCECLSCHQKNSSCDSLHNVHTAYYERNYEYWLSAEQQHRDTPSERDDYERHVIDLIRRNRHVVLRHKGFNVSVPEPIDQIQLYHLHRPSKYSHACHSWESEDIKTQKLIANGLWDSDIQQRYMNLIDDFKYNEAHSGVWKTENSQDPAIIMAFPRHEILVAASFNSSVAILESHLWHAPLAHMRFSINNPLHASKYEAKAMALSPASSVFTETTETQRTKLLAYSGLAGKLVARLFGGSASIKKDNTDTVRVAIIDRKFKNQSSFHVVQRVHSLSACEILMDNRYWFTGHPPRITKTTDNDTPIRELITEFRSLYRESMTDLKCAAVKYKRGFIGLNEIHSDPKFGRLYSLLLSCTGRMISLRNMAEEMDEPQDSSMKRTNRIMKFIAEFSGMYHIDIARVFGISTMRLRMATREAQLRLASQGSYAAFLSFAVCEPRMVDAFLAPDISAKYTGFGDIDCENHISSRHRVFGGELLKQYRHHIPRTADVLGDVCRKSL